MYVTVTKIVRELPYITYPISPINILDNHITFVTTNFLTATEDGLIQEEVRMQEGKEERERGRKLRF